MMTLHGSSHGYHRPVPEVLFMRLGILHQVVCNRLDRNVYKRRHVLAPNCMQLVDYESLAPSCNGYSLAPINSFNRLLTKTTLGSSRQFRLRVCLV